MRAGKFAVILGNRVLIACGNLGRVRIADGSTLLFIELAAQLQFQRVDVAQQLLVHLFDQARVPGETAGVEIAHLIDQSLQLATRLGAVLHCRAKLVQNVQALVNLTLGIGRVGTLLRCDRSTGDSRVAGVDATVRVASAIGGAAGRIAYRSGEAIADGTSLVSAGLTGLLTRRTSLPRLLAGLLTALAGLALLLAGLAIAAELSGLELLAFWTRARLLTRHPSGFVRVDVLRCTTSGRLRVCCRRAAQRVAELIAQMGQIVHGVVDRRFLGTVLSATQGAGSIADIAAQLLQITSESSFGGIGECAAAQLIGTPLQAGTQVVFVHAIERAAQLGRGGRLSGRKLARCAAQLLGKARQVVAHLLAIVDHFVDFLGGWIGRGFATRARCGLLIHQVAHAIGLLFLPGR